MSSVKLRASYDSAPLHGRISVSQASSTFPTQYTLKLLHEVNGLITPRLSTFRTMNEAIAHASHYGFLSQNWVVQTLQIPDQV